MAISVTVPGASNTQLTITTNANTTGVFNAGLAKSISDALAATVAPSGVTSVNGTFPAHVNNLALTTSNEGMTVSGGNVGPTYDYLTIQDGLSETVTAVGSGPFKVLAGSGNLNYTGLLGAQTVIAGGGNTEGGTNFVSLPGGASNYAVVGGSTVTVIDQGSGTIWAGGSSTNLVVTSSVTGSTNFVVLAAGSATVDGGAGNDTVFSGGVGNTVVSVGSGSMDFIGGANNATVFGTGSNTTTLIGGVGGSITYVGPAPAAFHAQGGAETLDASASTGANTIYGAYGQSGTETLTGGTGNDYLNPLNAAASLVGGAGADTLIGARFNATVAGSGNATLTGGAGNDVFQFVNGYAGGQDFVTDLSAGDVVNLAYYNYHAADINALISSASVSGGSSTITLSDSTKITFIGVAALNPNSFTTT